MSELMAVRTENLGRIYKFQPTKRSKKKETLTALDDVNVGISQGELFGLLGPNGAGKTTLIKILTTLLSPTTGRAWVGGLDVEEHPGEVRRRINMVSGGESSGYGLLTVRENLWMFSQFYGLDYKTTHQRISDLLRVVGLSDRADTKISDLSTGLRQKMNFVRGFITSPSVIFLDEPTLGLDVGAARVRVTTSELRAPSCSFAPSSPAPILASSVLTANGAGSFLRLFSHCWRLRLTFSSTALCRRRRNLSALWSSAAQ